MGLGSAGLLNVSVLFLRLKTPIHPANPSFHSSFSVRPTQKLITPISVLFQNLIPFSVLLTTLVCNVYFYSSVGLSFSRAGTLLIHSCVHTQNVLDKPEIFFTFW